MTAGGHLNTSETHSREAVSRLPSQLARLGPRLTQIQEENYLVMGLRLGERSELIAAAERGMVGKASNLLVEAWV
jgi:hypothetical protein